MPLAVSPAAIAEATIAIQTAPSADPPEPLEARVASLLVTAD